MVCVKIWVREKRHLCILFNQSRAVLLDRVLVFLQTHSWIYSFKWTELISCPNLDPVSSCPPEWFQVLTQGSIADLQGVVVGGTPPDSWPSSLKTFAQQCVTLTQELIQSATCVPQTSQDFNPNVFTSGLFRNAASRHLFYCLNAQLSTKPPPRKVKPKKHHEVEVMTAFLVDLMQRSLVMAKQPFCGPGGVTFQTAPSEEPDNTGETLAVCVPKSAIPALVDLGSGLGHLPRKVLNTFDAKGGSLPRCVAVEADPKLHETALLMETKQSTPNRRLIRLLTRVEKETVSFLRQQIAEKLLAPNDGYLLCGLHCCGDLSEAAMKLFHEDDRARALVLVSCCYHKMSLAVCPNDPDFSFPLSSELRGALQRCSGESPPLKLAVVLRLACQWSPQQWSEWSPAELYEHRVRVFVRSLLEVYIDPTRPPVKAITRRRVPVVTPDHPENVNQPLPDLTAHWRDLEAIDSGSISAGQLEKLSRSSVATWDLLPGITALQQLVQPLLEALVLADRLWRLQSLESVEYASLVRLFDPKLSPRCMALVAVKRD